MMSQQPKRPFLVAPPVAEGESTLLAEFTRGPRHDPRAEVVRWSLDTLRPPDEPTKLRRYITGRIWFRGQDGTLHPTRRGVTIRAAEIIPIVKALAAVARDLGLLPAKGGDHGA